MKRVEDKAWNIFIVQSMKKKYKYCEGQNIEDFALASTLFIVKKVNFQNFPWY